MLLDVVVLDEDSSEKVRARREKGRQPIACSRIEADEGKLAQSSSKASQSSSVGDSSCRSSLERGSIRARLASNGGSMPLADFLKLQGSLQVQKNKSTTSCLSTTSFDEKSNMHEDKRRWLQGDGRRDFEKRITQIKDRIEKKLVDEERVVLQQERVEMLERVCKQVQQEESHVLDSLRREILERMERNIREETQALLAKRRKEIVDEVEAEIQAEKLVRVDERRSLDRDKGAIASRLCAQAKEAEVSSLEGEGTNTGEVQVKLKEVGDTSCAQHRGQDEAESLTQKTENEHFAKKPNVDGEPKGTQNLDTPITISSRLLNEGEGTMKDSAQTLGADERKFEKSFHVQDSRTSLVLKLEVFLKVGTSNDLS